MDENDQIEQERQRQREWKELYDPDINKLIGIDGLPKEIWRIQDLQKRQLLEQCGVIDPDQDENSKKAAFQNLQFDHF